MSKKITIYPKVTQKGANHSSNGYDHEVNGNLIHVISETAWSPGIFKNNKRNKENFLYADFIALDIDNGLSLNEAKKRLKVAQLKAHLFTSRNHQKIKNDLKCDRFRIVFPLTESITTASDFSETWNFLYGIFPESDSQARDCSRFYYPSLFSCTITGDTLIPKKATKKVRSSRSLKGSSGQRIILTGGALEFLLNAGSGLNGEWNGKLNKAAYELARGGCSEDFAMHLIESVAPQALDSSDIKTFNSGYKSGDKAGPYKEINKSEKPKDEDIFELLNEEFENSFYIYEDEKGNRNLLLEQIGKDLVKPVSKQRMVAKTAETINDQFRLFLPTKVVERHVDNWITYTSTIKEQPSAFSFKDERKLAYHKLDFYPEEGETPTFDEFLSRCSNAEALAAFIWSIFENKSDRQQYVWISGEGGNGKSSFLRFLEKCMGPAYIAKNAGDSYDNKFFTASFVGKRLGVFPDANSRGFVGGEKFKQLTGGDLVPIEEKYEKPYSIKLDTKFILLSNNLPRLSGKAADIRRIILVRIDKFSGPPMNEDEYLDKWWEERKGILAKCKRAYEKLTTNHSIIECDHMQAQDLGDDSELKFLDAVDKHFIVEKEAKATAQDVWNQARRCGLHRSGDFAEFKEYLIRKHKVEIANEGRTRLYKGIKLK